MNIVIVEDQTARNMLVTLLDGQGDYKVVLSADRVEVAVEYLANNCADVMILDLCLPGLSYDLAIKAAKTACPTMDILVFTLSDEDETVFSALKAGATGYILKGVEPLQIIAAIDEIKAGGSPMSPSIARKILLEFQRLLISEELPGLHSPLSSRETEILDLLYKGCTSSQIGEKLFVSPHTVHSHIKNIYTKLHVSSRSQAIYEAVQNKFIRHGMQ